MVTIGNERWHWLIYKCALKSGSIGRISLQLSLHNPLLVPLSIESAVRDWNCYRSCCVGGLQMFPHFCCTSQEDTFFVSVWYGKSVKKKSEVFMMYTHMTHRPMPRQNLNENCSVNRTGKLYSSFECTQIFKMRSLIFCIGLSFSLHVYSLRIEICFC
jgi:hypothetical protein